MPGFDERLKRVESELERAAAREIVERENRGRAARAANANARAAAERRAKVAASKVSEFAEAISRLRAVDTPAEADVERALDSWTPGTPAVIDYRNDMLLRVYRVEVRRLRRKPVAHFIHWSGDQGGAGFSIEGATGRIGWATTERTWELAELLGRDEAIVEYHNDPDPSSHAGGSGQHRGLWHETFTPRFMLEGALDQIARTVLMASSA